MSSVKPNKTTVLAANKKAIDGVDKHFAKTKSLVLAGVSYTPAALKALLQAESDALDALDKGRAQITEQVATTRAANVKASAARKSLKAYILGNYGGQSVQVLEDFGFTAPKTPGPRTVATMAKAVALGKATRKARNTMGRKQRLDVKGVLPTAAEAQAPTQDAPAQAPVQAAAPAASDAKA